MQKEKLNPMGATCCLGFCALSQGQSLHRPYVASAEGDWGGQCRVRNRGTYRAHLTNNERQ